MNSLWFLIHSFSLRNRIRQFQLSIMIGWFFISLFSYYSFRTRRIELQNVSIKKWTILHIVYFPYQFIPTCFGETAIFREPGILTIMDYYCLLCIYHFLVIHSVYYELNYKRYQYQEMYCSVKYTIYSVVHFLVLLKCLNFFLIEIQLNTQFRYYEPCYCIL